jgi:hypothetical protein
MAGPQSLHQVRIRAGDLPMGTCLVGVVNVELREVLICEEKLGERLQLD